MRIGVVGINYKSSDLELRERVTKTALRCFGSSSKETIDISAVLLATCNRTEIYFCHTDLAKAQCEILRMLREDIVAIEKEHSTEQWSFEHALYSYFDSDCFAHLSRVTAGLDSAVLGESEIQRQVKMAYLSASLDRSLLSPVHFLFQKCLKIGKFIRSHFSLSSCLPTLEELIYELTQHRTKEEDIRFLFVGNSEINRKILTYFRKKRTSRMTLCTRSLSQAEELARGFCLNVIGWPDLASWRTFDVVICGTNYGDYLLRQEHLASEGETRTKLIFDLSMPRTVAPSVGRCPTITLFNIKELDALMQTRRHVHSAELQLAEQRVMDAVQREIQLFHRKEKRALSCV